MYQIETIPSKAMGENTYMISLTGKKECIVVDPGEKGILGHKALENKKVVAILLTHGHFDHIWAVDELAAKDAIPVYIHALDLPMVKNADLNLSGHFGQPFVVGAKVTSLQEGELFLGDVHIKMIHTPGHTKGSVCYQIGSHLFTGDTLFYQNHGRVDLPGGSQIEIEKSLTKILQLQPEITIYPGHGPGDTIKGCREFFYESGILHQ